MVLEIMCGTSPLTALHADKESKRTFISNKTGQVFIYDISPVVILYISLWIII